MPERLLIEIGQRIRSQRKAKGYSSAEKFAYSINMDRSQYSRCERGHNMTILTLSKICNALDLTLADLLQDIEITEECISDE